MVAVPVVAAVAPEAVAGVAVNAKASRPDRKGRRQGVLRKVRVAVGLSIETSSAASTAVLSVVAVQGNVTRTVTKAAAVDKRAVVRGGDKDASFPVISTGLGVEGKVRLVEKHTRVEPSIAVLSIRVPMATAVTVGANPVNSGGMGVGVSTSRGHAMGAKQVVLRRRQRVQLQPAQA